MRNNNNTNNNSPPPTYFGTSATYRLVQQEQQLRVTKRDPIYPCPVLPLVAHLRPCPLTKRARRKRFPSLSFLHVTFPMSLRHHTLTHSHTQTGFSFSLLSFWMEDGGGVDANASAHLSAPARAKIKKKGRANKRRNGGGVGGVESCRV